MSRKYYKLVNDVSQVHAIEFRCEYMEPKAWEDFHQHYEVEANLILKGSVTYLRGGDVLYVPAHTVIAFWGARPHQIYSADQGTCCYFVHIPLPWFLGWNLPGNLKHSFLSGTALSASCPDVEEHVLAFRRWSHDAASGSEESVEAAQLEIKAWMLRMAALLHPHRSEGADAFAAPDLVTSDDKVVQMVRYIAQNYQEPFHVADVAAAVGLHPNYAATLFKKRGGITIIDYITRLRVAHAQFLLTSLDANVLDIAFESGFSSACRFYRAFKEACGQTPGKYRAQMRSHLYSAS
jgi:AraC family transcriptional regulator, melibiose operon regulatory protein